jgi:dipeptidase E
MKKLFLASEGVDPKTLIKLRRFIGGSFKGKKIAYVPTAANGDHYGAWKSGGSIKVVPNLGADFKLIELESCVYQDVYSQIKGADILWIAGGQTGYLLYWFRRSGLDKKLHEILDSGTVYVGSSAGSMACSMTQYTSEWYLGEPELGASLLPGLGLIDFEIYPHYEEKLLPQIKKLWKKGELYLLKDGEVITVVGDKVEVLGKKRILRDRKLI